LTLKEIMTMNFKCSPCWHNPIQIRVFPISGNYLYNLALNFSITSILIALLVLTSLQFYKVYLQKTKLSEIYSIAHVMERELTLEFLQNGRWPAPHRMDTQEYSELITRAEFDGKGGLHLTLNDGRYEMTNKTLSFRAIRPKKGVSEATIWLCGYAVSESAMKPEAINKTDIDSMLLPLSCK